MNLQNRARSCMVVMSESGGVYYVTEDGMTELERDPVVELVSHAYPRWMRAAYRLHLARGLLWKRHARTCTYRGTP